MSRSGGLKLLLSIVGLAVCDLLSACDTCTSQDAVNAAFARAQATNLVNQNAALQAEADRTGGRLATRAVVTVSGNQDPNSTDPCGTAVSPFVQISGWTEPLTMTCPAWRSLRVDGWAVATRGDKRTVLLVVEGHPVVESSGPRYRVVTLSGNVTHTESYAVCENNCSEKRRPQDQDAASAPVDVRDVRVMIVEDTGTPEVATVSYDATSVSTTNGCAKTPYP